MALLLPAALGEVAGDSTGSVAATHRKPANPEGPTLTRLVIHPDGTATFEGRGAPAARVFVTSNGRGLADAVGDATGMWTARTRRGPIIGDHTLTITTSPASQVGIMLGPLIRISIPRGFAGSLMVGEEAGADGSTRARAERLAEAAGGQFDRIVPRLPGTRFAEVRDPERKTDAPTDQASGLGAILWRWLEQVQQSYQNVVIRQLERPAEPPRTEQRTAQSAPADHATEQALRQADADRRAAEARRLGDVRAKGAPGESIDTGVVAADENRRIQDMRRLEEQRLVEARRVEEARKADAKRVEDQRIADARAVEDKRVADKRLQDRIAAEKAAAATREAERKVAEEVQLIRQRAAEAQKTTADESARAEEARKADAKRVEDKRAADKREQDRIAAEKAAAAARETEQRRLADLKAAQVVREAESKAAEEARRAEQRAAERQKAAAEAARVEQVRKAEDQRWAEAARVEQLRLAEMRAAEERRKAEQEANLVRERQRVEAARLATAEESAVRVAPNAHASDPERRTGQQSALSLDRPAARPPVDRVPAMAARSQRRDTAEVPVAQKPARVARGARRHPGPHRVRERAPARWAAGGDPYRMSLGYSVSTLGYSVDRYTRTRMIPEIKGFFRCLRKRMGAL